MATLEPDPDRVTRRHRIVVVARWALGLGIATVAVWVAVAAAGGLDDSWAAIRQLDGWWLVPAFVIEAASYLVLGAKLHRLIGRSVVSRSEAVELGLVVSGFGVLTPASPAEGLALVALHLRRRGVPRRRITMVFAFSEWLSSRVFLALGAINLLVVAVIERDPLSDLWPFVVAAIAVLMLLGLTARMASQPGAVERISQIAGWFRRPSRRLPVAVRRAKGAAWYRDARELIGPARNRFVLAWLTALAVLADAACLWFALFAAGAHVGYDVALLSITVAAGSVFIPLVPGGIGIVEAAIPAVTRHFGVPYNEGFAAVLAYRALSTFLPAGVGVLAIVDLRRRAPASGAESRSPSDDDAAGEQ